MKATGTSLTERKEKRSKRREQEQGHNEDGSGNNESGNGNNGNGNDEWGEDDDAEWTTDVSKEAVKKRMKVSLFSVSSRH